MIGIIYPDKYAVEETFQLLKIPREWYEASMGKIKRKLFIFISTTNKIYVERR